MENTTTPLTRTGSSRDPIVAYVDDQTTAKMDDDEANKSIMHEVESPYVHQHMNPQLFISLVAMSFLYIGSQIPLYLFGSVLPLIYTDIGGKEIYTWMAIGYLIPYAAVCPFAGALSDSFGKRAVAAVGQTVLVTGTIVTSTAGQMTTAIGGQVLCGMGAGLNEFISYAGTAELVPIRKRGTYVGCLIFTILPFCPSVLWAQLIAKAANWRYVGIVVGTWNALGLLLVIFFYRDPSSKDIALRRSDAVRTIDYVGGFLSTAGVVLFILGLQWGTNGVSWSSGRVLGTFVPGIVLIVAFFVWELGLAPHPMVPAALFQKDKRCVVLILLVTFLSGGNFFVLLMFWPTEVYNVYGYDPIGIGVRSLPVGFGLMFGAAVALIATAMLPSRTAAIMTAGCVAMTAGTGALSIATPTNLNKTYAVITIASIAVGWVVIPCSIIAQIVCPTELIGTITAISGSVRYLGGVLAYTAYHSLFENKFTGYAIDIVGDAVVANGIAPASNPELIGQIISLAAESRFEELVELLASNPDIAQREVAYSIVLSATQHAYALAYRYPYWLSTAFGGTCILLSLGLRDIKRFL